MKKRILVFLCLLIIAPFLLGVQVQIDFPVKENDTGLDVIVVQQRLQQLGYLGFRPTGRFGEMSVKGVIAFQNRSKLPASGKVDKDTFDALFQFDAARTKPSTLIDRVIGPSELVYQTQFGLKADFKQAIDPIFPVGSTAKVIDFNTGKTFTVVRTGGKNHADVQPQDRDSYNAFLYCFGGQYTWEKRAVFVEINGVRYAASLSGSPNNNDYLKNGNMKGSVCIYFSGSTSDIGGLIDAEHIINIEKAAGNG